MPPWRSYYLSANADDTLEFGISLAGILRVGDVVSLEGELGTGKTVLARGIARGLGYAGPVQSPTFTIIHLYPGQRFCHVDAFRLSDPFALVDLGIEEYVEGDWICAVEWGDRVREALPEETLVIRICFGRSPDGRRIEITPVGSWCGRLKPLEGRFERDA